MKRDAWFWVRLGLIFSCASAPMLAFAAAGDIANEDRMYKLAITFLVSYVVNGIKRINERQDKSDVRHTAAETRMTVVEAKLG